MKLLRRLELEWVVLGLAVLLLLAFAWPIHYLFVSRLETTLAQSIDPGLEPFLRSVATEADSTQTAELTVRLERNRQWKAMLPFILREQSQAFLGLSLVLFFILIAAAFWTLRALTRPLRVLAKAVVSIGRGHPQTVPVHSGGALGTVEQAVNELGSELEKLREQARVQGMERAWQDIARVMAHEIKNPLTPIRLTLDRIEEKAELGEPLPQQQLLTFLERINTQVDSLERLVDQFRSFSREPDAQLRTLQAATAIEQIASGMSGQLTTTMSGSAEIVADPHLLNQVLLNLWKNALEAGATAIAVEIDSGAAGVRIIIADNGPGIAPQDRDRVWLPYVTLKKGGSGLGLAVVKKLIETMQASVCLTQGAQPGFTGCAVIITFPHPSSIQGALNT